LTGEHISGKFYEQEIQKVTKTDDDVYEVEKGVTDEETRRYSRIFRQVERLPGQIQQLGDGRDPIMNDHFFVTLPSDSSAK
jgi:hypothetical protein